jgi:hypothetical protein
MAEGRSNQAIAERMFVTLRAVEKHVTSIFVKLGRRPPPRIIAAFSRCSRCAPRPDGGSPGSPQGDADTARSA